MTLVRLAVLLLVAPCLLSACDSPIVGAECRPGFVSCDGECVDLAQDFRHCGACGDTCGVFSCDEGECTDQVRQDSGAPTPDAGPSMDGGDSDAGPDAGRTGDGGGPGSSQGGLGSPFLPDGGIARPGDGGTGIGTLSCGIGETACNEACVVLQTDPDHCGMCGVACPAGQFCAAGSCEDICEAPLTLCNGLCIDHDSDWRHCGGCNNLCASGICRAGECADAVAGHLVVIGHDYSGASVPPAMERLAGSALFLAAGSPVRTLIYRGGASAASVNGVTRAIERDVREQGRTWQRIEVSAQELGAALIGADALVIHAQPGASDEELRAMGDDWGMALSQFVLRGGVVVLFETDSEDNGGTHQILKDWNLFSAQAREAIDDQDLTVLDPGVGVAARSTRSYRSVPVSVHFLDVTSAGQVIVEDQDGEAVVVHRIVAP